MILSAALKGFTRGADSACRLHLRSYLHNWSNNAKRTQALPFTSDILVSLVTCAFLRGATPLAIVLLLGFVGLLRTGEIVGLKRCYLQFLGGGSQLHIRPNLS